MSFHLDSKIQKLNKPLIKNIKNKKIKKKIIKAQKLNFKNTRNITNITNITNIIDTKNIKNTININHQKKILIFLITILTLTTKIIPTEINKNTNYSKSIQYTDPFCGNGINPKNSIDCLNYSTGDFHCCKMYMENSIAEFNTCYKIMKNYTHASIINIGKSSYRIDCSGIKDYYKYFPFEEKFDPCGNSYPKSVSSCTDFLMENKNARCCLGKIKAFPDYGNCYSTIGLTSNVINYTTYYGDELTLFCSKGYLSYKISFNFIFFIFFLLGIFI
jgi:hypothetical protein